jgi:hypothetical protein
MAIVRLDKIAGTHLESIVAEETLLNGYFVELGGLVDGEAELRQAGKVADVTGDIVFHHTAEVDPDPRKAGLKHFEVAVGEAGRAYRLVKGDIVTLTEDLFDVAPLVGDVLAPQAGSFKLGDFDPALVQPTVQVKVIQETSFGFDAQKAFAVQVIKA